jgi:hypothetical protein
VPDDTVFVEHHVYEWGLLFEWSVAAAQLGDLDGALRANDELLNRPLPADMVGYVEHNRRWCVAQSGWSELGQPARPAFTSLDDVRRLDELVLGTRIGEIRLDVRPAWPQLNPTIAVDGDGFRLIVLTTSSTLETDGTYRSLLSDGTFRTKNYLVELDDDLRVRRVAPIVDRSTGLTRLETVVRGYHDCRLVNVGGQWFATATVRDLSEDLRCQMVLLSLSGEVIERVAPLVPPGTPRHEKNWMPVVSGDDLDLIYTCDPTTVLRCDVTTGRLDTIVRRPGPPVAAGFRGGSQGVAVDGGTLAVVHEVVVLGGRRRYTHRFVLFGRDYEIVGVSPAFCFTSPEIEFCAGLARRDGDLLLTFGSGDSSCYVADVDESGVLALLEDPS